MFRRATKSGPTVSGGAAKTDLVGEPSSKRTTALAGRCLLAAEMIDYRVTSGERTTADVANDLVGVLNVIATQPADIAVRMITRRLLDSYGKTKGGDSE